MTSLTRTKEDSNMPMVAFRIQRFNPAVDRRPHWIRYNVPLKPKISVLDALFEILEHQDATLGFRYSCRAEMCGSCAMVINGREKLACGTRLETMNAATITIEPLHSMPVIKDLVVDMAPFFSKYAAIQPSFVGNNSTTPAVISPTSEQRQHIDRQLNCISCGACFSACPVVATDPHYLGPAALNRAYTLVADERDSATESRLSTALDKDGVDCCRNLANCVEVCPVAIDPLFAIQELRKYALDPPQTDR
jgi:succinate dehydrogenase / fumarate reductase, iron-sulfur subunit